MWVYRSVSEMLLIFAILPIMYLVIWGMIKLNLPTLAQTIINCVGVILLFFADGPPPNDFITWIAGLIFIPLWILAIIHTGRKGKPMYQIALGVFVGMHLVRYIATGSTGLNMLWWIS